MNSEPSLRKTGTVARMSASEAPITSHFRRSDQRTTGS